MCLCLVTNQYIRDCSIDIGAKRRGEISDFKIDRAERCRRSRELHDWGTQIIVGLALSAQAARILLDRKSQRVAGQFGLIQSLAHNARAAQPEAGCAPARRLRC